MNIDQKTAELSNQALRETIGNLVIQGIQDRARIQALELELASLREAEAKAVKKEKRA